MRPPIVRLLHDELVVDSFAGGGGASTGLEWALGRPVDVAINHDPEAIAMHAVNHPETRHYREDIWEVDPRAVAGSRPVGILWASPDCTHFSRAKGGQPRAHGIRGLAWVVVRWAETVRPRIIFLENVEEFEQWGPLLDDGRPDPAHLGAEFRRWVSRLSDLGYRVEWRSLVAADYGTPTTRRRLFLVARRDDGVIAWPEPTHGAGRAHPWRAAAEIIDWTLPCPSIFDRKRQLAEATMRRIAKGIQRYVLGAAQPFIVRHGHYSTVTGAGLHEGCGAGTFRGQSLTHPLATVCATNDKHLVVPSIAPALVSHYGESIGRSVTQPVPTVTAGWNHHALVAAFVAKHYGGPNGAQSPGSSALAPIGTVTAQDHNGLVTAFLTKFYGTTVGSDCRAPMPTVTGGGSHIGLVRTMLANYCDGPVVRNKQQSLFDLDDPAEFPPWVTMIDGAPWEVVDIGMRMLTPRELFCAQGFGAEYEIAPVFNGKPLTKTAQTRLAGNSVCPQVAAALAVANAGENNAVHIGAGRQ